MNLLADLASFDMTALAFVSLAAWVYLAIAHGRFWQVGPFLGTPPEPDPWPEVAAVIPARNEAETIGPVAASHTRHAYPGAFSLTVVDDNSTDGTGRIARNAGATVVDGRPLERGWSGKVWALHQGIQAALRAHPNARYLLLTDADIAYSPGVLARLVAKAEAEDRALVSLMAKLDARGPWASLLIPAFIYFFRMLYPFARTNDPANRMAAAAGGCMLVRRDALMRAGGMAAIRGEIIDDCALARLIKQSGGGRSIWLGLTESVTSLRDNRPLSTVWDMVARTAFTQLRYSWLLLTGTVAGLLMLFAVPVVGTAEGLVGEFGTDAALSLAAWAILSQTFAPMLRFYGKPWWLAPLLPVAGMLYTAMTVSSALRHARGSGARWKGRTYPAQG